MNLLESAGFSRSNPYYIVKQGKVRFFFAKWKKSLSRVAFFMDAKLSSVIAEVNQNLNPFSLKQFL